MTKDVYGIELPPPGKQTIDLEGRVVKDGVKKALRDRQDALSELVEAVRLFRKLADSKPLTLQGADFAEAVDRLNAAVVRSELCCSDCSKGVDQRGYLIQNRPDEA